MAIIAIGSPTNRLNRKSKDLMLQRRLLLQEEKQDSNISADNVCISSVTLRRRARHCWKLVSQEKCLMRCMKIMEKLIYERKTRLQKQP